MSTSINNRYDEIEKIIFVDGLRIQDVYIHYGLKLISIFLNNRKVLTRKIESYPGLAKATKEQMNDYRLISDGIGISWPKLDEDLSLKMFLKEEIRNNIGPFEREVA